LLLKFILILLKNICALLFVSGIISLIFIIVDYILLQRG